MVSTNGQTPDDRLPDFRPARQRHKFAKTTDELVKHAMSAAKRSKQLRHVKQFTYTPVVTRAGKILTTPGWDPESQIFYHPTPDIADLEIPDDITQEQVHEFFDGLLPDFPFDSDASKQNYVALNLTPLVLPYIDGLTPMFVFDAAKPGTGKTLLATIVYGLIIYGRCLPTQSLIPDLAEFRKQLTSALMIGESTIVYDNVNHRVDNPALAQFLTSYPWRDRVLGGNQIFVSSQKCVTIATGNNFQCSDEISRRIVAVRLESPLERPEDRSDFKHPNLSEYLRSVRPKALGILLGMCRKWIEAGRPVSNKAFGSFEEWTRVVGGILELFGFTEFLGNRSEWQDSAQVGEDEDIRVFIEYWSRQASSKTPKPAKDLVDTLRLSGAFPEILDDNSNGSPSRKLGRKLSHYKGQTISGYRIRFKSISKITRWWLEKNSTETVVEATEDLLISQEVAPRIPPIEAFN